MNLRKTTDSGKRTPPPPSFRKSHALLGDYPESNRTYMNRLSCAKALSKWVISPQYPCSQHVNVTINSLSPRKHQGSINRNLSEYEKEILGLLAAIEAIDSMINNEIFELKGLNQDRQIYFHTDVHQMFFNVLLIDFLSEVDEALTGHKVSCLGVLKEICKVPKFNIDDSIDQLASTVSVLDEWLEAEVVVDTWLPSIDKQLDIKILRREYIKICGNISKHHFARLTRVARDVRSILERSGMSICREESMLVLDDIFAKFHEDTLNYHGSWLAEMLNNIRWGMHEYLLPEFNRAIQYGRNDPMKYEYEVPDAIGTKFGRSCYWKLMNNIRRKPCMPRFKTTNYLKLRN